MRAVTWRETRDHGRAGWIDRRAGDYEGRHVATDAGETVRIVAVRRTHCIAQLTDVGERNGALDAMRDVDDYRAELAAEAAR